MTKEEVRRGIGRPAETMEFETEELWRWRYVDFAEHRMLFDVRFDPQGRVKDTLTIRETSARQGP